MILPDDWHDLYPMFSRSCRQSILEGCSGGGGGGVRDIEVTAFPLSNTRIQLLGALGFSLPCNHSLLRTVGFIPDTPLSLSSKARHEIL